MHTYLPQDRRRSLAAQRPLPANAQGSALFADIAGSTALITRFATELDSRRGIEAVVPMSVPSFRR